MVVKEELYIETDGSVDIKKQQNKAEIRLLSENNYKFLCILFANCVCVLNDVVWVYIYLLCLSGDSHRWKINQLIEILKK